ncbi:glycoside hydrolase family 3 C-terminal domain-containing protein [Spirochaeta isovalerica]|uniref:Beta-glucosidase n=1 Tax=Spirochaeta isovalerica TaxID=150 RepID=A0A841RB97_9SPIO|nr:beta-glucosidase [Spirochaeta isovalerica]
MRDYIKLDQEKYAALARQAAAEGCVLLKNDKATLPVRKGESIALFGRSMFHYYKSGLGSGGLVNTRYTIGLLDALKEHDEISTNESVLDAYENWLIDNPYDEGQGWGKVPWSQAEMPLHEELVRKAAEESDLALIVIGRTGGEDQDSKDEAGSYRLTELEEQMIATVCRYFPRSVVILNTGNIIDMSWLEKSDPSAVLAAWQGGQEGGHGVVDILTGDINPCGRLTDTIALKADDYPSTKNFGDLKTNIYEEDIYVGYRYFETFAKEKVLYPFGFGLSYTDFTIEAELTAIKSESISVEATIINRGYSAGKEIVQVYSEAPQGKLGKPVRVLVAYGKTEVLKPGESASITLDIPKTRLASYDDSGVTGSKSSFILEAGRYNIYAGSDVRQALKVGSFEQDFTVIETLEEACAPVTFFNRLKPVQREEGFFAEGRQPVPLRTVDLQKRIDDRSPEEIAFTGDRGISFGEVYEGKTSLDDFIAQLSDEEMACLTRGEGMSSPKATPGVAAAFGGLTDSLADRGIPVGCCADGPSGIRMDCGTKAFSLPNGTALGCTFNDDLVRDLFVMLGRELRKNRIETILGPGINIHRNPLNGRNFEYISEDPLLTGKIAAAQLLGMAESNVTGTIKHFVANNQEAGRSSSDSVVSERALREIYLKGFEIAVKEGGAYSVMTTYGALNGIWTAGNYDLCTTVLRDQWGFHGIAMTDWWAQMNFEGEEPSRNNTAAMIRAQNDLYMCVGDSATNAGNDNTLEMLEKGVLKRAHLQRSARNILKFLLGSLAMEHKSGRISDQELKEMKADEDQVADRENLTFYRINAEGTDIDGSSMNTSGGSEELFGITVRTFGMYDLKVRYKSDLNVLAQVSVSVFMDNQLIGTLALQGTEGEWKEQTLHMGMIFGTNHFIKLFFPQTGLDLESLTFKLEREFNPLG